MSLDRTTPVSTTLGEVVDAIYDGFYAKRKGGLRETRRRWESEAWKHKVWGGEEPFKNRIAHKLRLIMDRSPFLPLPAELQATFDAYALQYPGNLKQALASVKASASAAPRAPRARPRTLQNVSELLLYDDSAGRFYYAEPLETMVDMCYQLCTDSGVDHVWVNTSILVCNLCTRAAELCPAGARVTHSGNTTTSKGEEIPHFRWSTVAHGRQDQVMQAHCDGDDLLVEQWHGSGRCLFRAFIDPRRESYKNVQIKDDDIRGRLNALRPPLSIGGQPLEECPELRTEIRPYHEDEMKIALATILAMFETIRQPLGAAPLAQSSFIDM